MTSNSVNVLMPQFESNPSFEAAKARKLFVTALTKALSYDDLSNNPDYMVYASAETIYLLLPKIIDEMISNADTHNYLIYHVLTAIDPSGDDTPLYIERFTKLIPLIDETFANTVHNLLSIISEDLPIEKGRYEKIRFFWANKRF